MFNSLHYFKYVSLLIDIMPVIRAFCFYFCNSSALPFGLVNILNTVFKFACFFLELFAQKFTSVLPFRTTSCHPRGLYSSWWFSSVPTLPIISPTELVQSRLLRHSRLPPQASKDCPFRSRWLLQHRDRWFELHSGHTCTLVPHSWSFTEWPRNK